MGETVPKVLSTSGSTLSTSAVLRPRAQFLQNMDRPRQVNNIFIFSYRDLKVLAKFYLSLQPLCVEEGCVRVDVIQSVRSIANQNKTYYNIIFNL